MAKKTDSTKLLSNMFALRGSWETTEFRFHEGSAAQVQSIMDKPGMTARDFRNLASVALQVRQGYVGTNATVGAKEDELRKTNPGQRDCAYLQVSSDTLVVVGTLKFVPTFATPERSDSPEYTAAVKNFCEKFIADGLITKLMARYLTNVVDGTMLWRNKYGFSRSAVITIRSTAGGDGTYRLTEARGPEFDKVVQALVAVAKAPQKGMDFLRMEVALAVELGPDAEVFPSQLFIDSDAKNAARQVDKKASYGRMLSSRADRNNEQQVCFSSQKIGNALRRVDLGYVENAEQPIAIELYGAVTAQQVAHRGGKNSYFNLVQVMNDGEISEEDRMFLMGCFIKGGLLNTGKE